MDTRGDDGIPKRVHLEQDAYGLFPNLDALAKLESAPSLPELTGDVWEIFKDLHNRREWDENGPKRWLWREIESFQNVTERRLGRWKLKTILEIEEAYFQVRAEHKT